VEFCLTKLQAQRATSSTFAALRLCDVLNAFGLFARAARSSCSTNTECGLTSTRAGGLRHFIGVRVGDEHVARARGFVGGFRRKGETLRVRSGNCQFSREKLRKGLVPLPQAVLAFGGWVLYRVFTDPAERPFLHLTGIPWGVGGVLALTGWLVLKRRER